MNEANRGRIKEITSVSNPIVKDLKALSLKKRREETGLFLAEGAKLVLDALETGWTIRTLVVAKQTRSDAAARAVALTITAGGQVLEASDKVLAAIAKRDNPQNVIGAFAQRLVDLDALQPGGGDVVVALDRVRDPGNLGTIIRTADAAGVAAVALIGETTDPFSLEAVRATMGSIFAVPLARAATTAAFLAWAKQAGARLIGTHLAGAVDYRTIDYDAGPVVLLMGNEQAGLPDDLASACHALARIPQTGRADSLNLAVATALMIYEARRNTLRL